MKTIQGALSKDPMIKAPLQSGARMNSAQNPGAGWNRIGAGQYQFAGNPQQHAAPTQQQMPAPQRPPPPMSGVGSAARQPGGGAMQPPKRGFDPGFYRPPNFGNAAQLHSNIGYIGSGGQNSFANAWQQMSAQQQQQQQQQNPPPGYDGGFVNYQQGGGGYGGSDVGGPGMMQQPMMQQPYYGYQQGGGGFGGSDVGNMQTFGGPQQSASQDYLNNMSQSQRNPNYLQGR
jgi:hypothetical protein